MKDHIIPVNTLKFIIVKSLIMLNILYPLQKTSKRVSYNS